MSDASCRWSVEVPEVYVDLLLSLLELGPSNLSVNMAKISKATSNICQLQMIIVANHDKMNIIIVTEVYMAGFTGLRNAP